MGSLLKIAICGIGCVYLLMHVAYALTSAADSIKNRDEHAGKTIPPAQSRTLDHDAVAQRQDTVGFEQRTSS